MLKIVLQLFVFAVVISGVLYFLSWRLFSRVGGKVDLEVQKIKKEIKKETNKGE